MATVREEDRLNLMLTKDIIGSIERERTIMNITNSLTAKYAMDMEVLFDFTKAVLDEMKRLGAVREIDNRYFFIGEFATEDDEPDPSNNDRNNGGGDSSTQSTP